MKMIIIGGSAGSFNSIITILKGLDKDMSMPIIIILHRLKRSGSMLENHLQLNTHYVVKEADDKEVIRAGYIYTAPSDYHLLLEENLSFSLDTSEKINYSRPSIDVSFESFSSVLKENCFGILLSGNNEDGAIGLKTIVKNGGETIVQDYNEAAFPIMPQAAIKLCTNHTVCTLNNIIKTINYYAK
jgi:two-component system chemotaxis response regulator CheB